MNRRLAAAFIAIGVVAACATGPSPSSSVLPSAAVATGSPSSAAPAGPASSPALTCGQIAITDCLESIELVRRRSGDAVAGMARIVVDDVCPPEVVCDRRWAFDALVVLVAPVQLSGDVGLVAEQPYEVTGVSGPEIAMPYGGEIPAHIRRSIAAGAPSAGPTDIAVGVVAVVSRSDPSSEARDVLARCHIGEGEPIPLAKVTGIARLANGSELTHFVPLTGREPELAEPDPVWVVQVRAEVQQRGDELWIDATCIVTSSGSGYYATGPVMNVVTGTRFPPPTPRKPPDRKLPEFQP